MFLEGHLGFPPSPSTPSLASRGGPRSGRCLPRPPLPRGLVGAGRAVPGLLRRSGPEARAAGLGAPGASSPCPPPAVLAGAPVEFSLSSF